MSLANVKKGETVALLGFTGIRLADVVVSAATKTEISVEKKDGAIMVFDRKTGVQKNVDEGKEKYANKIVTLEDAPEKKERKAKAKPVKKAVKKVEEIVEEDEDEDEDEEEEEEAPAPKKKAVTKKEAAKPAKKAKKPVVEDDEDDEYEEM